jgi:SAM-dependent methyltransferase
VSFLLKLIDSGVDVLFADLPELNGAMGRFMLTTMASVAELEAGLISERTKAALKAAKARGVKLGSHGAEVLAPQYRAEAHQRAQKLQPLITELKIKGLSLAKIASELNKRKCCNATRWTLGSLVSAKRAATLNSLRTAFAWHYASETFDAIACLSVVEHGVDLSAYFREAARILKPGGILITSTDYWQTPIDTRGQQMYGVPVLIFTQEQIKQAIALAAQHGLVLTSKIDLSCDEKVVHWSDVGLDYTFVVFTLRKGAHG